MDGYVIDWAIVIAVGALGVSAWSAGEARKANQLTRLHPVARSAMDVVNEELLFTLQDRKLYVQICKTPFEDLQAKRQVTSALHTARDESNRRLEKLDAFLGSQAVAAVRRQQRTLTESDDSFVENGELELPMKCIERVCPAYENESETYARELRRFLKQIADGDWKQER